MSDESLSIRDVTFLNRGPFSFSLARGECIGLSGRSGIGKTQLFKAITDLIPHEGLVSLGGRSSSSFPAPVWRSKVTMVAADSSWWYDVVGDHFRLAESASFADIFFPKLGFSREVLNWRVNRLSTGERQRLALLRTLQHSPLVLLLDEPSSGLDGYHAELMEQCVAELQRLRGLSVVWVSHDPLQLKRVAVRELRMEADRLVEIVGNNLTGEIV